MNSLRNPLSFMRSFASRDSGKELSDAVSGAIEVCRSVGFDLIIVETSGIGQGDDAIASVADVSLYVTTREYGAPSQLEKLAALDFADLVVLNKFDRPGAEDALVEIRKQVRRNREMWDSDDVDIPVVPTIASRFADAGVDQLWERLSELLNNRTGCSFMASPAKMGHDGLPDRVQPIPPSRHGYLAEVSNCIRAYHEKTEYEASLASTIQNLEKSANQMEAAGRDSIAAELREEGGRLRVELGNRALDDLAHFDLVSEAYSSGKTSYTVREGD